MINKVFIICSSLTTPWDDEYVEGFKLSEKEAKYYCEHMNEIWEKVSFFKDKLFKFKDKYNQENVPINESEWEEWYNKFDEAKNSFINSIETSAEVKEILKSDFDYFDRTFWYEEVGRV